MVCHLVAPRASEPSRKPRGTDRSDSSLAVMMTGRTMKASVNQPARSEMFQPRPMTKTPTPKSPKTMEGTPARLMMARRMVVMTGPWFAYSLR
jgi:hypothetical protein